MPIHTAIRKHLPFQSNSLGVMLSPFGGGRVRLRAQGGGGYPAIHKIIHTSPFNSPSPKESCGQAGDTRRLEIVL